MCTHTALFLTNTLRIDSFSTRYQIVSEAHFSSPYTFCLAVRVTKRTVSPFHYSLRASMFCFSARRIPFSHLILITVCVTIIRYACLTPCERTIQFNIKHSHRSIPPIDAFCILNRRLASQQSSALTKCSSVLRSEISAGEHFDMFHHGCSYCCLFRMHNVTHETAASGLDAFQKISAAGIGKNSSLGLKAEHSLPKQLTLDDIGIKKVFVINLDSRQDRLVNVVALLGYLKFPFTRFSAINMKSINKSIKSIHPNTKFFRQASNRSHTDGQIGTWQSHLQVYFRIVEESKKDDRSVLILEDDFDMEVETPALLKQALQSLPNDWDMYLLGHCYLKCTQTHATFCKVGYFLCTHAYIIRNSTVASRIIGWSNTVHTQIADYVWLTHLKRGSLVVYASYPTQIVVQDGKSFGSDVKMGRVPQVSVQRSLKELLSR